MRSRIQLVLTVFAGIVSVITTARTAPAAFSYGIMQNSCAPWDGAAIAVCSRLSRYSANEPASHLSPSEYGGGFPFTRDKL